MTIAKSIDGSSPRSTNQHIIASIDAEPTPIGEQLIHKTLESMQKELTELSAYVYDNIGWHQVHMSIDVAGCWSFLRMVSRSCCSSSILVLSQSTLLLRGQ
ncbi:hypothetical protein F2Q70_00037227 [Brassica cretica]|uniref:Uncharacterized protein n=1 Tax=Brassica cretica TaxID=69181 RepID=A0A8S9JX80_BRACR|nr:hypothetical protein F2Q70_00037227 [Brassica cretica]